MQSVLMEKNEHLGIITLNRPKSLNAMNADLVEEFHRALDIFVEDEDIHVIILTGAGRAFCTGGDLGYLESLNDDKKRKAFIERVGEMTLKLRNCAKPVIGMINGVTAGAGVNLMLACDIVCSSEDAKFIQSFVNVGLVPDCGGMYLLKETVGLQKAKELMFTADVISAQEAEKLKMVMHVYTKEDLKIETEKIAQKIAQGAPMAIMYMKKMLNKSYANLKDFLDEEALVQTFCLGTEDCKEGILAFKQKRQPNFQGK